MIRVLRPGGSALPRRAGQALHVRRRQACDADRHLLRDHREGPEGSRRDHYEEWARLVDKVDEPEAHATALLERGYSIHFHAWTQAELLELLRTGGGRARARLRHRADAQESPRGDLCAPQKRLRRAGPRHRRRRLRGREPVAPAGRSPPRLGDRRVRQPAPARVRAQCPAPARSGRLLRPRRRSRARDLDEPGEHRRARRVLRRALGDGRPGRRTPTTWSGRTSLGAHHCLELARRDGAQLVFLSTSRVYPVEHAERARLPERPTALRARAPTSRFPARRPAGHLASASRSTAHERSTARRSSRPSC